MEELEHRRQKAWESYYPALDDLIRISQHGPNVCDEEDELLVRSLCNAAIGEILCRCGCVDGLQ